MIRDWLIKVLLRVVRWLIPPELPSLQPTVKRPVPAPMPYFKRANAGEVLYNSKVVVGTLTNSAIQNARLLGNSPKISEQAFYDADLEREGLTDYPYWESKARTYAVFEPDLISEPLTTDLEE